MQLPAFRDLFVLDLILNHCGRYADTCHLYSPRVPTAALSSGRYISEAESEEMAEPTTFLAGMLIL
jgi:hypothetical protein